MLDFETVREQFNAGGMRPDSYDGLLLHAISENIDSDKSISSWEFLHGKRRRFYVGGMNWFFRSTGMSVKDLASYSSRGVELVRNKTTWRTMPFSEDKWDLISAQQFYRAAHGEASFFPKAALVIATCEAALLSRNFEREHIELYSRMRIIPACWQFTESARREITLRKQREDNILSGIANDVTQSTDFLLDLSEGCSCTYFAAIEVYRSMNKKMQLQHLDLPTIYLKTPTRPATKRERFDLG